MFNFDVFKGFLLLALIFIPLERIFTLHKQKIIRPGCKLDILYFFIGHSIGKLGLFLSASITTLVCEFFSNKSLRTIIDNQASVFQFLAAIFIAEIGYYFAHRLTHTIPFLWRFHQIHHSIEELDWLTAVRVHPFDQVFTKLCQMIPLYFFGFSAQILGIYFLFSAALAFFIHANIRLRFPVLKYLIVTPEFHHWHHFINHNNHNYSAQLPVIDWLFGTFYLPKNKRPQSYGVAQFIPLNYWRQIIFPFQ